MNLTEIRNKRHMKGEPLRLEQREAWRLKMSKHPPYTLSVIVCQISDLNTFGAVIATLKLLNSLGWV